MNDETTLDNAIRVRWSRLWVHLLAVPRDEWEVLDRRLEMSDIVPCSGDRYGAGARSCNVHLAATEDEPRTPVGWLIATADGRGVIFLSHAEWDAEIRRGR